MDKKERKIIKRQLADVNRETQMSDIQISSLENKKIRCCLAHLRELGQDRKFRLTGLAA